MTGDHPSRPRPAIMHRRLTRRAALVDLGAVGVAVTALAGSGPEWSQARQASRPRAQRRTLQAELIWWSRRCAPALMACWRPR